MTQFFGLENLTKFYEKHPNSIAFAYLAARLIEKQQYQEAIDLCRQGIQSHPQYAFGHYILGVAYYHLKNYNEAKKELELSLAHDAATPKGWEILSTVNEILNLSDDANDSNLNSYLYDVFNEEAANNFVIETREGEIPAKESAESREKTDINILDTDQELTDKDIDELISTTTEKEDKGDDFLKTLDDIFIEKEAKATESGEEIPEDTEDTEMLTDSNNIDLKDIEEKKEDIVTAEEFTSAIDSFFSEYEEKGKEGKTTEAEEEQPVEPEESLSSSEEEISTEEVEDNIEEGFEELKDEDLDLDQETEQETSTPQFGPVFEVSDEDETTVDEPASEEKDESESESELMDFSSVVSDIIEDEDKESMPETEILSEQEGTSAEELTLEEKEDEGETPTEPEEKTSEKKSIPTPDIHELDRKVELKKDSDKAEDGTETKETMKFGRPPILSPTLGEIYIAQGRFEEAIDVFRQLLEKDPDSARFKRKIQDLEAILKKKDAK
jgi:tetratricopeptide (TPR) repeat protein